MINEIKEAIIKMNVGLAEAVCETNGLKFRVISVDGVSSKRTMEYCKDRLNVAVEKGFVVAAFIG